MKTGIIIRINGPIVEARHMEEVGMLEVRSEEHTSELQSLY